MLDQTRYKTTGIWETEYSTHRKPQPNIILAMVLILIKRFLYTDVFQM